jgi:hypothetical protein
MVRSVEVRLSKLEAVAAPAMLARYHRVIGSSEAQCETGRASLIAAGKASRDDNFIFRLIVAPKRWSDHLSMNCDI